jgi:hypothetical protein
MHAFTHSPNPYRDFLPRLGTSERLLIGAGLYCQHRLLAAHLLLFGMPAVQIIFYLNGS